MRVAKNKASGAEIRKARSFLYSQHRRGFGVKPRKFAAAAKELNVPFRELLRSIALMYARGQGGALNRAENLRRIAARGAPK
jgi:hypothetical protein